MEFRTIVDPRPTDKKITHRSRILMLGSCFSGNISERLCHRLFNVVSNPFGQLYNPASILQTLRRAAEGNQFTTDDLVLNGNTYCCFDCHTLLSDSDADRMLARLNERLATLRDRLLSADYIFLTLGTAWVFSLKSSGKIVANCHKLPPSEFDRQMLTPYGCTDLMREIAKLTESVNPKAQVVFTISPIRHLADGAHGNQISKATLLLSIENVVELFANCDYFPAYEIILDDLRDYRFYDTSMTHPTAQAADYIFEKFATTYFDQPTMALSAKCEKLYKRLHHRQMTTNNADHQRFTKQTEEFKETLLREHPYLNEAIIKIKDVL
ncbi:MAG: GSCFA domain-containing protein [Bacteroides sp.]|nr:GSCFA domain-containing protein [Bacteroides sp.]MCM1414100.1 GSCFA domain-containing protein [Bacteroides sp.]MCM1472364.1 GSCFA domain-containing protein [Bacteroides sp.]